MLAVADLVGDVGVGGDGVVDRRTERPVVGDHGQAAAGALIGAVMKEMRGQADAGRVRELILEKLAV